MLFEGFAEKPMSSVRDDPKVILLSDCFVPHRGAAMDTRVVVLISLRQDKKKAFPYGNCPSTLGTVQFCRFKISVARLFHESSSGTSSALLIQAAASLSLGAL